MQTREPESGSPRSRSLFRRYGGAAVAVLPGLALAMLAKQQQFGEWALLLGLFVALIGPVAWLLADVTSRK